MTQTQTEKTRIVEFRVFGSNNYSQTDRQHEHTHTFPATLAGLAGALDRATIEGAERRGCTGTGSHAVVEAVFDVDDEGQNIEIGSVDAAILQDCAPLEFGASRLAMARRAGRLERETFWDGHNHSTIHAEATRRLMELMAASH